MKETWENLSNEELCIEYQKTNSNELFEYFMSRNIGLVMDYANRIAIKHPDQKEELVQVCKIALWEAMKKYSPDKECKFTTYCHYYFKKGIWHHWHSQYSVHLPINLLNKLDEVKEKVPNAVLEFDSLDRTITSSEDSGETTLEELVAADQPSPEDIAMQNDTKNKLLEVINKLSPREVKCVQMYYGLNGYEPHTLQMIGDVYNVTRERIRQIEAKALRKLRHPSRSKHLKDFLDT